MLIFSDGEKRSYSGRATEQERAGGRPGVESRERERSDASALLASGGCGRSRGRRWSQKREKSVCQSAASTILGAAAVAAAAAAAAAVISFCQSRSR